MTPYGYDLKVGERVRLDPFWHDWLIKEKGSDTALLTNTFCEYGEHMVCVQFDDGSWKEINEEHVTPVEDPYEYNIIRTSREDGFVSPPWYREWMTLDDAESYYLGLVYAEEEKEKEFGFRYADYKMVKRRKAGEIEDVEV